MLAAPLGTGTTKPYQIIAPEGGATVVVGREGPLNAEAEEGNTRVEALHKQTHQRATRETFPDLIPCKPYCADDLNAGLRIRSRACALKHRHLQINGPSAFTWMPFDIDRPGAYYGHDDANLPPPNIMMVNPANGHAHSAYLLQTPVARHSASRLAPLRYFSMVERGIARRIDADRRYTGLIVKNPLHATWKVAWLRDRPYSLSELADWLFERDTAPDRDIHTTLGAGRNVTVFDELRAFAYREVLSFKRHDHGAAGLDAFRARLEAVALGINTQFPEALNLSEVRAIARSVAKWTWSRFTSQRFSHIQSHRAKTRTRRHLAVVQEIKNASAHDPTRRTISATALAARLNSSTRTAQRVWAEPRAEFEARSLSRQRPWEAAGISRRTWYRRRTRALQLPA